MVPEQYQQLIVDAMDVMQYFGPPGHATVGVSQIAVAASAQLKAVTVDVAMASGGNWRNKLCESCYESAQGNIPWTLFHP